MLTQLHHSRNVEVSPSMAHRDPAVQSLLAHARPCALSFYHPDELVYGPGEPVGPLYLLEFGTVRICRLTAGGRRQISAFHLAGEVFGFEPAGEHENYAECIESAGIRLLRPNPDRAPAGDILAIALRTLARTQDHLTVLGRMSAAERVAAFLLDLYRRQQASGTIELAMQRQDIADYLGLTIETVSRALKALKDSSIVRLPNLNQVEVLDLKALQRQLL